ncbi:MAG TPA: hypothetical protein VJ716_01780 [Gaiellaceae bacterium]|nr:hypothetical protein [Gaiellaceae bacterium]
MAVAVAVVSACGSSHGHLSDYSLAQVKHAFAAEGLRLHEARYGPALGVIKLTDHQVEVDVDVGQSATRWESVTAGNLRTRGLANVIVSFPPSQRRAVKAALAALET